MHGVKIKVQVTFGFKNGRFNHDEISESEKKTQGSLCLVSEFVSEIMLPQTSFGG